MVFKFGFALVCCTLINLGHAARLEIDQDSDGDLDLNDLKYLFMYVMNELFIVE